MVKSYGKLLGKITEPAQWFDTIAGYIKHFVILCAMKFYILNRFYVCSLM